MAKLENVKLRRSYQRKITSLLRTNRFKSKGRRQGESQRMVRRLRIIAGILVRELKRTLSPGSTGHPSAGLGPLDRVQRQQRSDTGKIYSLHEPGVSCISKGKAHKKYEFGAKASVSVTKPSGIIFGALSFQDNPFDGHTVPVVLSQIESIVGQRPTMAICDRGYRDKRKVGVTSIEIPKSDRRTKTAPDKRQARERFRRRAAIEPIIDHLKNDHRMLRNYLKGQIGDTVNLFMACAAFNFRKFIRFLCFLYLKSLGTYFDPMFSLFRPVPDVVFFTVFKVEYTISIIKNNNKFIFEIHKIIIDLIYLYYKQKG